MSLEGPLLPPRNVALFSQEKAPVLDEYPPMKSYAAPGGPFEIAAVDEGLSIRVRDLREAIRLTADGGDRNRDYGDPVENHQKIADIFGAITGKKLTAREVAFVLLSVKLARTQTAPGKGDSYVDAMAYLGIAHECAEAEAKDG